MPFYLENKDDKQVFTTVLSKDVSGLLLYLNGCILLETGDKDDCHIAMEQYDDCFVIIFSKELFLKNV